MEKKKESPKGKGGKNKNNKKSSSERFLWKLLPLEAVIAILPLITYHYAGYSGYSAYEWNSELDYYHDFFLYWKMICFMIASAITLGLLVWQLCKNGKKGIKQYLITMSPMLVYAVLALVSAVFADNRRFAFFGAMDQFEPFPVLLGYVVIVSYAYFVVETKEDLSHLFRALLVGGMIMSVLGVLQAIGKDPIYIDWFQNALLDKETRSQGIRFSPTFESGRVYGTLFNPNYVGSYVALMFPVLLGGMLLERKWQIWVIGGLESIAFLIMLFFSQSRTGMIAVIVEIFVLLILLLIHAARYWYLIIPGITLICAVFSLADLAMDQVLSTRLKGMIQIEKDPITPFGLDSTGNGIRVIEGENEYTVGMAVSGSDFAYVVTEQGQQLTITYETDKTYAYATLADGTEVKIQTAIYEDLYAFGIRMGGRDYYFTNQLVHGNYKYINEYGRLDEIVFPDSVFRGYERGASSRVYIWGRTIPLLKKYLFLGVGPDNFVLAFPQSDYVGKYYYTTGYQLYTRPHNMFLQIGVNTGVLSLLCVLVFYMIYFVKSVMLYGKRGSLTGMGWFGCALFLATIGFLICGLGNDSLIVVSPVFWTFLGCGMAVNAMNRKEKKEKEHVDC